MSDSNENNKAEEPGLNYQTSKKIMVFSSFEKMNDEDARIAAETDPLENFRRVTELLKRMYAKELEKPMDKTIYIRTDGIFGKTMLLAFSFYFIY